MDRPILYQDLQNLLSHFAKNLYKAPPVNEKNTLVQDVMERCKELLRADYIVNEIPNDGGELSACYPATILIPNSEKPRPNPDYLGSNNISQQQQQQRSVYDPRVNQESLRELLREARYARCRCRFVLPVILFKGKYVCRSATLSGGTEMHCRQMINIIYTGLTYPRTNSAEETDVSEAQEDSLPPPPPPPPPSIDTSVDNNRNDAEDPQKWALFDVVRNADIKLLKAINVGTIVDLMVEKKKVKYGVYVTSSEKVDKEKRYSEFAIVSMPYPGCEFFRDYRLNNYSAKKLLFDWKQSYVDQDIDIPKNDVTDELQISWEDYRTWDLLTITRNYLKLTLQYLQKDDSGILIHCISGWDRTPLFVSLLRLSLWADGAIHKTLDANQILYFTIAYDWFLFGHNLPDRLSKGEEIFYFCFYFLGFIAGDEYSIDPQIPKSKTSSGSSISIIKSSSGSELFDDLEDADEKEKETSEKEKEETETEKETKKSDPNDDCSNQILLLNVSEEERETPHATNATDDDDVAISPPRNTSSMPKTSPVPITARGGRTRQESSSSVGSWTVVENANNSNNSNTGGTGGHHDTSLPEADDTLPLNDTMPANDTLKDFSLLKEADVVAQDGKRDVPYVEVPAPLNEDDSKKSRTESTGSPESSTNGSISERRQRLMQVRALFFNLYDSTIGFRIPPEEPPTTFGKLMGTFVEKVVRTSV